MADLEESDSLAPFQQRITPGMVSNFVKTHLRFDTERLFSITFVGVELIVPIPQELEEMVQLAGSFDYDDRFAVWPVNLDALKVFEPMYT